MSLVTAVLHTAIIRTLCPILIFHSTQSSNLSWTLDVLVVVPGRRRLPLENDRDRKIRGIIVGIPQQIPHTVIPLSSPGSCPERTPKATILTSAGPEQLPSPELESGGGVGRVA